MIESPESRSNGRTETLGTTETRSAFWDLYNGKRAILGEALLNHDPGDQFAWCQEWRFALADVLAYERGVWVEGYESFGPDDSTYAYDCLTDQPGYSDADLLYAYDILTRYREWLRIAGVDY